MRITRQTLGLWTSVTQRAESSLPGRGAELDPALPLYSEAARALMSRCPTASAVVARGCLESTLRAALLRMDLVDERISRRIRTSGSRRGSSPGLDALIDAAREGGLLSPSLCGSARRIKEDGDFGAHLAERWDSQVLDSGARMPTPSDMALKWKPIRLWISSDRALSNLRALGRILRAVCSRASMAGAKRPGNVSVK